MNPPLTVDRSDGVVTVTIDRPAVRNALDTTAFRELRALITEVAERAEDRVLVVTGAGGTFCSGGDLSPARRPAGETPPPAPGTDASLTMMRQVIGETALALHRCPKPVIAAVDGTAAGAGAALAFGCDLVFASTAARFGLVFVRRGLSLDLGASWLLPRLVGPAKAKELAFYGDWIDAAEAHRLGLVNDVVEPDALASTVRERAVTLARRPTLAVQLIKQSLNRSWQLSLADAVEEEAMAQVLCSSSPEFAEAMAAFRAARGTGTEAGR